MSKKYPVKCRFGVDYEVELTGTKGTVTRTLVMLGQCCCFVCHNHSCSIPREEKVDCHGECRFFWSDKPCEK